MVIGRWVSPLERQCFDRWLHYTSIIAELRHERVWETWQSDGSNGSPASPMSFTIFLDLAKPSAFDLQEIKGRVVLDLAKMFSVGIDQISILGTLRMSLMFDCQVESAQSWLQFNSMLALKPDCFQFSEKKFFKTKRVNWNCITKSDLSVRDVFMSVPCGCSTWGPMQVGGSCDMNQQSKELDNEEALVLSKDNLSHFWTAKSERTLLEDAYIGIQTFGCSCA
eukprot:767042-Hanusia_phi.AAC.1